MENIKPLDDRVLVRRIESETKTASGIIIPDTAKDKPIRGTIVAAGPGKKDDSGKIIPLSVKVGDVVIFATWSGTAIKINNDELLVMKESDLLAVVE